MFLDNLHKVIKVTSDNKYDFIVYNSDKEECDILDNHMLKADKEIIDNILAYGEVTDIDEKFCSRLIHDPKFINNLLTNSMSNSYKCFCCDNLGIDQLIGHMSARSSWQCLINSMGNPTHIVVMQVKRDHAESDIT